MSSGLPYDHVNGFCHGASGGNAAGVVLPEHDAGLSDGQRQGAAAAIGFSETVFVSSIAPAGEGCAVALRYFTPEGEVDLCGHATVACLGRLHERGLLQGATSGVLRTRAGEVGFRIEAEAPAPAAAAAASVFMEQLAPRIGGPLPAEEAARWAAALGGVELDGAWAPRVGSTGLRDLLVAVRSGEALRGLRPDMAAVAELSRQLEVVGVHAFCFGGGTAASPLRVRNFAPLFGIDEESATGTSNCALACALHASGRLPEGGGDGGDDDGAGGGGGGATWHFAQGDAMGMPSRIAVRLPEAAGGRPQVGGRFRHVQSCRLAMPKL